MPETRGSKIKAKLWCPIEICNLLFVKFEKAAHLLRGAGGEEVVMIRVDAPHRTLPHA